MGTPIKIDDLGVPLTWMILGVTTLVDEFYVKLLSSWEDNTCYTVIFQWPVYLYMFIWFYLYMYIYIYTPHEKCCVHVLRGGLGGSQISSALLSCYHLFLAPLSFSSLYLRSVHLFSALPSFLNVCSTEVSFLNFLSWSTQRISPRRVPDVATAPCRPRAWGWADVQMPRGGVTNASRAKWGSHDSLDMFRFRYDIITCNARSGGGSTYFKHQSVHLSYFGVSRRATEFWPSRSHCQMFKNTNQNNWWFTRTICEEKWRTLISTKKHYEFLLVIARRNSNHVDLEALYIWPVDHHKLTSAPIAINSQSTVVGAHSEWSLGIFRLWLM